MANRIEQPSANGHVRFMTALRAHFISRFPTGFKAGQIYKGKKEISFFTFTPLSLHQQKLKIAIVWNYQNDRFEIWLAGQNRQIQKQCWSFFKDSNWSKYPVPNNITAGFSIVDSILVANPNFNDADKLILQIEAKAMAFIQGIADAMAP